MKYWFSKRCLFKVKASDINNRRPPTLTLFNRLLAIIINIIWINNLSNLCLLGNNHWHFYVELEIKCKWNSLLCALRLLNYFLFFYITIMMMILMMMLSIFCSSGSASSSSSASSSVSFLFTACLLDLVTIALIIIFVIWCLLMFEYIHYKFIMSSLPFITSNWYL